MSRSPKIEILAPAGGPEALKAAVFAGADAVYLAGKAFGARANAKNFSPEELREAVEFCHSHGVKVHVTVNTLLKDTELEDALAFVKVLCALSVDAVLVQDMGLFSLIRERAPALPIHASTQMSLMNPAGAEFLAELGAKRVVLARELSLKEIREISTACSVEVEAFVHGALCMSVSGQCYFSAMLGGRSGNRGQCAQTCRLPFAAPGGTGHDLSLKDLSFIEEISCLKDAGVCSAKIEGRMKRPEYVAAAVTACRQAAEGEEIPRALLENLRAVFSRSGFTQGYLTEERGKTMFGIRTKEDVTGATEKIFAGLRELYRKPHKKLPVRMALTEQQLTVTDGEGRRIAVSVPAIENSMPVLPKERCLAQLRKTGDTPFAAAEVTAPEDGVQLSVGQLNALRRQALEDFSEVLVRREKIAFAEIPFQPQSRGRVMKGTQSQLPLRAYFRTPEQVCESAKKCEAIALPLAVPVAVLDRLRQRGFEKIFLDMPRAAFGAQRQTEEQMQERIAAGYRDFICNNLGDVYLGRKLGATLHGGFGLNVFNSAALKFFREQGLSDGELSFELTAREADRLGDPLPRGVMLYGRQPVMLTRNCPLANGPGGCRHCKAPEYLTDRTRRRFPVICTGSGESRYSEVLNCVPLWLADKLCRGADFGILRFTVEKLVESEAVLEACFRQSPPDFDCTRGLSQRGVE